MKSYLTVISGLTNKLVVGGVEHPTGSAGATTGAPLNGNAVTAAVDRPGRRGKRSPRGRRSTRSRWVSRLRPRTDRKTRWPPSRTTARTRRTCADFDPKSVLQPAVQRDDDATTTTTDQATKLATVRKSVLDSVLADGTALEKKLGAADKQRVEQHLDVHSRHRGAAR